ncbi:MAG: glycosyltransferase [Desulfuromonas sp.]|mgnify:CR=1 FL=1|nr:MAG: glycosyltransferase [Desulfuromonas sp.]
MKKIIFVLPDLSGGGAEKAVLNLYKVFESHLDYECHIVTLSSGVSHEVDPGCRIHYLNEVQKVSKKGFKRLTYRKKICFAVDDYIENNFGKGCIVLSNMMFADKVMSKSRHNVIHIIHSVYGESLLSGKNIIRKFFIQKNLENVYGSHPLVFVSQGACKSFCENFKSNVPKYVIYNPINQDELLKLAEKDEINIEGKYILHLGRFNREKRHDRLLKAFAKINSCAKLVLLGEGKLQSSVFEMAQDMGLKGRVVFAGFQKNPYPYIKNASLLVLSSDFEALPTVVLEGASLGVPVVATNCPGGIEEIVGGDSPSLVPLEEEALTEAIQDALCEPQKYISLLDHKFSEKFAAEKYYEIFSSV